MSKEKTDQISNSRKEKSEKSPKYENWSKQELREKAKEVGIKNYSSMKKTELIYTLRNH